MTKVLVTMGRRYGFIAVTERDYPVKNQRWTIDYRAVETFKTALYSRFNTDEPLILIHGVAPGEEMLVGRVLQVFPNWTEWRFPADWETYGKSAGPRRNLKMLDEGKPDLCLAFPGGYGTNHMKSACRKAGIPVEEVK